MSDIELCIGCSSYDICNMPSIIDNEVCPCATCIIKSTCQGTCEKFDKIYKTKCDRKICEGCFTNGHCDQVPSIGDIVCPCIICLIKTMCANACEEYTVYEDLIDQSLKESYLLKEIYDQ